MGEVEKDLDYSYDNQKDAELKKRRGLGFEDVVNIFFKTHYWEFKNDNPEQYLAIAELDGQFWSVVYEEWEDELGAFVWLVTFWPSTSKEVERFYRHVHGA